METGTWLSVGALLISAAGALNSMRTGQREDRSSAVAEIRSVVDTLRQENERLKVEIRESEEECRNQIANCREQIAKMKVTVEEQAIELSEMRRQRRAPGTRSRKDDGE